MSMEQIVALVGGFEGVLDLAPGPGSGHPEIAWGDHFLYYAPDGVVPQRSQPFATIVTKDYPGDTASRLDEPGRWRLNVRGGREARQRLVPGDPAGVDTAFPHPVYPGWIAIVLPGERTMPLAEELLRAAYRSQRAMDSGSSEGTSGAMREP